MIIRALLLAIIMLTGHDLRAAASDPLKVQLVMWDGASTPAFEAICHGETNRVLFRKEVEVSQGDLSMRPLGLLRKHLDSSKLKEEADFYWRGAVYRPAADGKSASLVFSLGALRKFKLADLKAGDVIVYFRETF